MSQPLKYVFTTTLLSDGRVLVAGGGADSGANAAQLYDPGTGTFGAAGSMTTARRGYSATLLNDGRVLIAGGYGNDMRGLATAELYDPVTGGFSPTGSMTTVRSLHVATLLKDGRVLIIGGYNGVAGEIYNPDTGEFHAAGTFVISGGAPDAIGPVISATTLADGRVLVVQNTVYGVAPGGSPREAEIFDPLTETTALAGRTIKEDAGGTATLLSDGRVLLTGGVNADIFDPAVGRVASIGEMGFDANAAARLPDGRVLLVGSPASENSSTYAEIYDPASSKFEPTGAGLNTLFQSATSLADGRVLCISESHGAQTYLP